VKTKSMLAAFVAAVFGTMMFAAPAMAGGSYGHHYPPPTCTPSDAYDDPDILVSEAYDDPPILVHEAYTDPDVTVIDVEAVDKWYSWTGGPSDTHPAPPAGSWQVDNGNHNGFDQSPGLLQRDKGNSGESDWFYHVVIAEQSHVVPGEHHDAVYAPGDHHDAVYTPGAHHDAVVCPPPGDTPVPAVFNVEPVPATCDSEGSFDTSVFPIDREGYTLNVDRPFDGPGDYTITATAKPGFVLTGEVSRVVTVEGILTDGCGEPPACVDGQLPVWYVWTGGPQASAPAPDADGWHATSANPGGMHAFSERGEGIYNVSHGNSGKSSWFKWVLEDSEDCMMPREVTPTNPVADDQCGTENDTYLLPEDSADITYAMGEDGSITATLTSDDVVFGSVPEGWASTDDAAALVWVGFSEDFTDEPCVGTPTGIPFSVTPEPASCDAAGSFDAASLGGAFNEETGQWEFENVDAEVLFDNPEDGDVTINLFAHEGFVIEATPEQLADGWFVEAGGARASLTITLEQRLTVNPETGLPCQFSAPIETAPQIVQIDACGVLNDGWDTVNEVGITYTQEGSVITATADEGYVLIASNGWTGSDGVTATLDLEAVFVWNDAPCTTTTTPGVTPVNNVLAVTTPSQARTLAATGSNGILGLGALAALLLVMGGSAAAVAARRK